MNYFNLLNIEQKFNIDIILLNQNYLKALVKFHPDKANNADDKESLQVSSAEINKAYQTLKDDLSRAEYLLSLSNIYINNVRTYTQMEFNDFWVILESIENNTDTAILDNLYKKQLNEKRRLTEQINIAFENNKLQEALESTINLKYVINLINKLQIKLDNASY